MVSKSVAYANQHFEQLWIVDASTLEALFRKLKSLESLNLGTLGGRICAVVDLKTRYPVQTWFHERPYAHESNFVSQLLKLVVPKTLLLLDRGFWNYSLFEQLIELQSDFITRLKTNAQYESVSILSQSKSHQDTLIRLGTGYQGRATNIIAYLTAPKNRDLGIVKSPRPKRSKPTLDLSASPS